MSQPTKEKPDSPMPSKVEMDCRSEDQSEVLSPVQTAA